MATAHTLAECPQNPTLDHIMTTLTRLDAHGERTARALEAIAAQSVAVEGHEKRLDKHDQDFRELFSRVNDQVRIERVEERVFELEKKHAREDGADEVIEEQKKFWTGVKTQLTPYAPAAVFFVFYLLDRFGIFLKALELWKEFSN